VRELNGKIIQNKETERDNVRLRAMLAGTDLSASMPKYEEKVTAGSDKPAEGQAQGAAEVQVFI